MHNLIVNHKRIRTPLTPTSCQDQFLLCIGVTGETLKETVDLGVKLNTDSIAVGLMVPYPGKRILDLAMQGKNGYRLLSQNWSEYDKYGGKVLQIDGFPYAELVKWQQRTYLRLYLVNRRFKDCFEFFWKRRKGISFVLKKKLLSLLEIGNRNYNENINNYCLPQ